MHHRAVLGRRCEAYAWGQNEAEVTIKVAAEALSARQVALKTTSRRIRLAVGGSVVCEGELCKPIISDESTFVVEDAPAGGRLLTVTLTKATPTSGPEHWRCAVVGEAEVDTKKFGPAIISVNPRAAASRTNTARPAPWPGCCQRAPRPRAGTTRAT